MNHDQEFAIGLDLGTSGMKAVALDGSRRVAARSQCSYPTRRPALAASEQDPDDWFTATKTVLGELATQCDSRRWLGIGLSGMMPTLVVADGQGNAIGAAITWEDGRANAYAVTLADRAGARSVYELTGQRLDGRYLLPMYLRFREERRKHQAPELRGATIRSAKDHLFAWLTGRLATDPSTATGFGCYELATGAWNGAIRDAGAAIAGESLPDLPPVQPSNTFCALRAPCAAVLGLPVGIPVVLGAADSVLGALGLGVDRVGDVAYIAGTSNVILGVADAVLLDEKGRCLVTPLALEGLFGLEMDILATGSSLAWLSRLFGMNDVAACAELASSVTILEAPLFLPYLGGGEQGALWDPTLQGAVVGLDLHQERHHIARGLLNGIILESRRCFGVLEELGVSCEAVHVAGGSASSAAFLAGLADATGRPVRFADDGDVDFSAIGAARLVQIALGSGRAEDAGATERAATRVVIEPDPANAETWERLARKYDDALSALRPIFSRTW